MRGNTADIAEIGTLITSTFDVDRILAVFMDTVLKIVRAEVGSVMLSEDGVLKTRVEWGLSDDVANMIRFKNGTPLHEEAFKRKEILNISDLSTDEDIQLPTEGFKINSYLSIPLKWRNQIIGVANIINHQVGKKLNASQQESLTALCSFAVVAIENSRLHKEMLNKEIMERELEMAAQVQRALLPEGIPELTGISLEAYYTPVSKIGGDYYDAIPLGNGMLALAIADVAGHGVSAAMLMSGLRSAVRSYIRDDSSPQTVVDSANQDICIDSGKYGNAFITFCFVVIDTKTGEGRFTNAGHPQPMKITSAGEVEELSGGSGLVLGLMENEDYEEASFKLNAGDSLFLCTDGVFEHRSTSGEIYGRQRMMDVLSKGAHRPVNDLLKMLVDDIAAWSDLSSREDDITVLMLKMEGDDE